MLWFFESFCPVVWIPFLLYWQNKAANTKTTQCTEPAASCIVRVLALLIVIAMCHDSPSRTARQPAM